MGEGAGTGKVTPSVGLREGEMKLVSVELLLLGMKRGSAKSGGQVFRAMQAAYVRLLQTWWKEDHESKVYRGYETYWRELGPWSRELVTGRIRKGKTCIAGVRC